MVPVPYRCRPSARRPPTRGRSSCSRTAGERLAFEPGQFTMLSAFGSGEVPISISGDPGWEGPLVHTVRAVGLATKAICDAAPGDVLGVRGPFGHPWPVEDLARRDVLVVAGGVGLAPLRTAILALLARREQHGRIMLLYGGRSPDQLLFADELDELGPARARTLRSRWTAQGPSGSATSASSRGSWLVPSSTLPAPSRSFAGRS